MLTRRIATSVCALCLAIPAAAGASPATKPPQPRGAYGSIPAGPRSTVKAKGAYGSIPAGLRSTVKAKGPYGIIPAGPRSTVKAKGPYGVNPPRGFSTGITPVHPQHSTGASVHAAGGSPRGSENGWRTAAISEAALLATVALGLALLLSARRRSAHLVT
jgi:hypothetical protein